MLKQMIRTVVGGFFMGMADLVPGVSGGTIALVLGIYERLVNSVREGSSALGSLIRADLKEFRRHMGAVDWLFLVPLLGGILSAVILLAGVLETQLHERPTIIAGLFLGLVLASVVIAWRLIRDPGARHPIIALVVTVALFLLLGVGEGGATSDPSLVAYFGAGALAICAMILPGISGSLVLLLLGMYASVLASVTDRDLLPIAVLVAGAVLGLALFSQILHWALENHHDDVLAGLVGLMAGSTRVLWPWPDGVESAALDAPASDWAIVILAAALGAVAVVVISRLAGERDV